MRTYKTAAGPFREHPFYKLEEIESICLDELRNVGLLPAEPEPVRIERFIEKRFRVHPAYEDLPKGLLGFTRFGPRGVEEIVVSQHLAEDGGSVSERRINTTLAHEAGHGLLHTHLFALGDPSLSLFGEGVDVAASKILCRSDGVVGAGSLKERRYDGRWWEFQANQMIGGLLLPRPLVEQCLRPMLVARGVFGRAILDPAQREASARALAEVFQVNPVVARIRLQELYPAEEERQLTL